jgi:hypothetical protein
LTGDARRQPMVDVLFILASGALFAATVAYRRLFDRL